MKIIDRILDLIYPPKCPFCRKILADHEDEICSRCRNKLPCIPTDEQKETYPNIRCCVAPLYYEGSVRESLLRYKFGGVTAYRDVYAHLLTKCVDENQISCDIITWVPLSKKRLRRRGYDQARLIAEKMADRMSLPCVRLLNKFRNNPPQSGTAGAEVRKANVRGVYECLAPSDVQGKRILIVDDIVTTGSTLMECAKILMAAGAKEVYAAAVARSHR